MRPKDTFCADPDGVTSLEPGDEQLAVRALAVLAACHLVLVAVAALTIGSAASRHPRRVADSRTCSARRMAKTTKNSDNGRQGRRPRRT